jgi:tRNA U34 5-carboxymethylaminomethyl modifying GTPase MnmE/TrmE
MAMSELKRQQLPADKAGMYRNILNEIRYLREQCDAIEKETQKGQRNDYFDGDYIAEKLRKAQSAIEEITKDISLKGRRMY